MSSGCRCLCSNPANSRHNRSAECFRHLCRFNFFMEQHRKYGNRCNAAESNTIPFGISLYICAKRFLRPKHVGFCGVLILVRCICNFFVRHFQKKVSEDYLFLLIRKLINHVPQNLLGFPIFQNIFRRRYDKIQTVFCIELAHLAIILRLGQLFMQIIFALIIIDSRAIGHLIDPFNGGPRIFQFFEFRKCL